MTTLYRKYRPQTFSSVFGQEYILQTLQNEIKRGTLAHAYVFYGPRGTGKTTIARLLSKAINCQTRAEGSAEPCDTCRSCTEITAGRSIDVIEVDAASQTGVDNVRENIIENAQFKPTSSKYKIFIIDEVHMLSTSSFNALLKTLEEPPAHAIFILATTELQKLPATVVSRCERFHFKNIPYELMKTCLQKITVAENISVEDAVLDRIIRKSEGGLRDAESLLGQVLSLTTQGGTITAQDAEMILPSSDTTRVQEFVEKLLALDVQGAILLLSRLKTEGANLNQFALDLVEMLHTLLIIHSTHETSFFNGAYSTETLATLQKSSGAITAPSLVRLIDLALKRRAEMKTAILPDLPLELLAVEFCTTPEPQQTTPATTISARRSVAPTSVQSTTPVQATSRPATPLASDVVRPTLGDSIKSAISTITGHHTPTVTIEDVQKKWAEIISKLSETNHSLTFILKMSALEKIDHEGLHLTVPYVFHKEKLEEMKNRRAVEAAIEGVLKEQINLNSRVVPAPSPYATPTAESSLNNLAAEFGGEVVG
jgi:DNA polymerase-3 subunit gamma/tau